MIYYIPLHDNAAEDDSMIRLSGLLLQGHKASCLTTSLLLCLLGFYLFIQALHEVFETESGR